MGGQVCKEYMLLKIEKCSDHTGLGEAILLCLAIHGQLKGSGYTSKVRIQSPVRFSKVLS